VEASARKLPHLEPARGEGELERSQRDALRGHGRFERDTDALAGTHDGQARRGVDPGKVRAEFLEGGAHGGSGSAEVLEHAVGAGGNAARHGEREVRIAALLLGAFPERHRVERGEAGVRIVDAGTIEAGFARERVAVEPQPLTGEEQCSAADAQDRTAHAAACFQIGVACPAIGGGGPENETRSA